MTKNIRSTVLLLLLVWVSPVLAGPLVIGGEITLTDQRIIQAQKELGNDFAVTPLIYERVAEIRRAIKAKFPQMKITDVYGVGQGKGLRSFRINFASGFWLEFGADPYVVEVKTKPSSIDFLREHQQEIQSMLFDLPAELGLKPHKRYGMGHFNIDAETAFNERSETFRDFLVDMYNHPELAWAVFATKERGGGVLGAPHFLDLRPDQQEAFRELIRRYDAATEKPSLIELAESLEREVYFQSVLSNINEPEKYQGVNVRTLADVVREMKRRIELRWLHPQQNFQHFLLIGELFENRLDYLIKKRARDGAGIPIDPAAVTLDVRNAQGMLDRYYDWVREMDGEWARFGGLVQTNKVRRLVPSTAQEGCPLTQDLYADCQFPPL